MVIVEVEEDWARLASDLRGAAPCVALDASCDNDGDPVLPTPPAAAPANAEVFGGVLIGDAPDDAFERDVGALMLLLDAVARLARDRRGGGRLLAANCAREGCCCCCVGEDDGGLVVDVAEGCASAEREVVLDASPDPAGAIVIDVRGMNKNKSQKLLSRGCLGCLGFELMGG